MDSLLARPEVQLSVFLEEKDRLSAELWKVHFVPEGDGWRAGRYASLLAARLGFRFSLREDAVYAFDRLTFERAGGVFQVEDGLLMPGFSGDRIGRVVLVGKGRFTFTPPDRVERQPDEQVRSYDRCGVYDPIRADRADPLPRGVRATGGRRRAVTRAGRTGLRPAEALLKRVDRDYLMDMRPARERFSLGHSHPAFLQAEIDLADSDRWLVYTYSPYESEAVSLVQKSGFPRNPQISPPRGVVPFRGRIGQTRPGRTRWSGGRCCPWITTGSRGRWSITASA